MIKYHTKPWKHQEQALKYLMPRSFGALFTDMGSGKTKVMIDLIVNRGFKKTLVVTKTRICSRKTWETEIETHSDPETLTYLNLVFIKGKKRPEYLKALKGEQLVVIVNYESVWREPLRTFLLKKWVPDCVICDESHKIKGRGSKVSKFLTLLGKRVPNRFIMTGTWGQNPLDIYGQYRFIQPSIFGTRYNDFKHQYANWVTLPSGIEIKAKKDTYKNLDELQEKIYSCAFEVPVDQNLPPTQDITIEFELPDKVQSYYKELRKESCLELKKGTVEVSNVLTIITRLQQLTSGYLPVEDDSGEKRILNIDNSRVEAFQDLLEDIDPDEPVVVFCKYVKDIKNVKKASRALGRGVSELSGRMDTMDDWIQGKTKVLVLQIAAGAEGLNELVKAKYCIYYSLHQSLLLWLQSRKRLHRPGQTRPVIFYTLVAKLKKGKTIDENILSSLKNNRDIIDSIREDREV